MAISVRHRDISSFLTRRGGSNSWADSEQVVSAWRRGDLIDVPPLTLEFSPVLDCNADCPLCPYRSSRLSARTTHWKYGRFASPNSTTVSDLPTATRVLSAARQAGVRGVLWTGGGEPTLFEALVDSCRFAAELGMVNGLYTNGFLLGTTLNLAQELLAVATAMVFVRVSINAVSPESVRAHWGMSNAEEVLVQLDGLRNLLSARERLHRSPDWSCHGGTTLSPSVQVSTIVDHRNIDDLPNVCEAVAEVFDRYVTTPGPEDVMVVRPAIDHRQPFFSASYPGEKTIRRILEVCGARGEGRRVLNNVGVPLVLGFGLDVLDAGAMSDYAGFVRAEYAQRDRGWASGLFLTVGPDGSVYPCMEMNCHPGRVIGNLNTSSVDEIYHDRPRIEFVREADRCHWGPEMFHPHSRTARLDRIARAIMRRELGEDDLDVIRREATTSHRLLLN